MYSALDWDGVDWRDECSWKYWDQGAGDETVVLRNFGDAINLIERSREGGPEQEEIGD